MKKRKSVIPDDLQAVLKQGDINFIFKYFEHEFHLSKSWRIDFHSELLRQAREISELEFFCLYIQKNIEPILKKLLRRKDNVALAAIRYLLKDRLEGKIREARRHQIFIFLGRKRTSNDHSEHCLESETPFFSAITGVIVLVSHEFSMHLTSWIYRL